MQGMRFHHFGSGGGRRGEREDVIRIISQLEEEAGGEFLQGPGAETVVAAREKTKGKVELRESNFGSEAHDFA